MRYVLDRSMEWRVFAECVVDPGPTVVCGELDKDPTQVCLAKHHQMVDALPPDRADQSFRKAVLPWRTGRDRLVANAHGAQAALTTAP
jgi:hypothetical protein